MKAVILILIIIMLSGCADSVLFSQAELISPVGFLHGLWHGMIFPISFLISLFSDDVAVYAIYNNGGWYDFGFCIGCGALFGGSSKAS